MVPGFLPWTTRGEAGKLVADFSDAADAITEVVDMEDIIRHAPHEG